MSAIDESYVKDINTPNIYPPIPYS
jgi:hypothetical protein